MDVEELHGGWGQDTPPVRIGNTIHRQSGENSEYVHSVLQFLEKVGYDWAPRYLGTDEEGREVLDYIEGYVPHGQQVPKETWSLSTMQDIFRHIRKLHDLTAKSPLAEGQECVCHGDLSYANTVYRDGKAVAIVDWDWARPGRRIEDVAHALLQYLSIGEYESPEGPEERATLARNLVDAYGLPEEDRHNLTDLMLQTLLDVREKQLKAIEEDKPAAKRLDEAGVPDHMIKRHKWLEENQDYFRKAFQ